MHKLSLFALAAIGLSACSDHRDPTQPTLSGPSRFITCDENCGGGGSPPPPPPQPSIAQLSIPNFFVPIDGELRHYTATLTNTGSALNGASLQGWMIQGSTIRAAGGIAVDCHAGLGVLPNGTCAMSFTFSALTTSAGSGLFQVGGATFELDLMANNVLKAKRTFSVALIPTKFSEIVPSVLSLSGAAGNLTTFLPNTGPQAFGPYRYQIDVIQGSSHRSAGSPTPFCGTTAGWVLAGTTCATTTALSVKNSNAGAGTLVAGSATLQVQLLNNEAPVFTQTSTITLVDARFTDASTTTSPIPIGGAPQTYTFTLTNNSSSITGVSFDGSVRQGTAQRQFTSDLIQCGVGAGILPSGPCTLVGDFVPPNDGGLVPGPATLSLVTRATDAAGHVFVIDSVGVPITLAAPPTIGSTSTIDRAVILSEAKDPSYGDSDQVPGHHSARIASRGSIRIDRAVGSAAAPITATINNPALTR